jgi:hypothetical protein
MIKGGDYTDGESQRKIMRIASVAAAMALAAAA